MANTDVFEMAALRVRDVMTQAVVTLAPQRSVPEAITLLARHRFRHLPVVEDGHRTTLATTRLNYSFTPHMFLDTLIQYNSTVKEITSNIRFNFIYKPLSDLFVVYNERRSTTGEVRERALIGMNRLGYS